MWRSHREIFGEYELKSVSGYNGRPHYEQISGNHGIWYDDVSGRLTIGLSSSLGTQNALAYVRSEDLQPDDCPYDPAYTWFYKKGNGFQRAELGLTIKAK